MSDEFEWESVPNSQWVTRYAGWYQIEHASPVCVGTSYKSEREATTKADEALQEKLKQVIELGLSVEATVWTVKQRERKQYQEFEPAVHKRLVTAHWYGRLSVVDQKVHETNENSVRFPEDQ